jgi:hypothetical protein
MSRLPAATRFMDLLKEAPTTDDIEVQLQHASSTSSPGLDGVGYDVYKRFVTQLLPVLKAAFKCCWTHKKVPQSWKLGVVRLLYKKGDRGDPANWRPICLQQAINKIYTGVLARRLARWQDANDRHAPGQKGFRPVNGCGEHNFLAAMLIDQARRKHRPLYEVWYDFRNAFGSVPLKLLWDALERSGVPGEYIAAIQGLYEHAAFMVGNAVDGSTAPILQRVGVPAEPAALLGGDQPPPPRVAAPAQLGGAALGRRPAWRLRVRGRSQDIQQHQGRRHRAARAGRHVPAMDRDGCKPGQVQVNGCAPQRQRRY